jgi:hypothetical protein
MQRRVIDEHAALGDHLLDVPKAQRVGRLPAHAHQHHFQWVVHLLNHSAQRFKHLRTVKHLWLTLPVALSAAGTRRQPIVVSFEIRPPKSLGLVQTDHFIARRPMVKLRHARRCHPSN